MVTINLITAWKDPYFSLFVRMPLRCGATAAGRLPTTVKTRRTQSQGQGEGAKLRAAVTTIAMVHQAEAHSGPALSRP